jgi:serine/threonine protein kinase
MVKIWYKLFYKNLFYYKNKDDKNHKGMHNLSGLFLKKEATKILDNKIYYSFSIIFPNKKRTYFCDDMKEFKNWIKHLRIAINYSNILDLYIIKEKIGSGSFSEVKLAINKITKQKVAVKIMDKKKMNSSRLESARIEIEIMKICQFPYIIKFIEAYENIDYIYIFMEYCQGGTLFEFMKKRNFLLSEQLAATITYKLCLAIYYFHSYGITHRDLKPDNILMTSNDDNADIKILDFGLGKIIGPNETCSEPYGTVIYCAPEILLDRPYTKNVDSWSLGIITYCLLFGRFPFYHDDRRLLKISIINSQPVYKAKNLNNVSDDAINFMQNLLIKNPNKRMNIEQALEHKWLKKFNQNNIIQLKNLDKDKKSMIESFNLKNYRIKQFCS